jgi:hypothetical protein
MKPLETYRAVKTWGWWCHIDGDDRSSSDIFGQRKEVCETFGLFVHHADGDYDYYTECIINATSLQGLQQKQRQRAKLKR